MSFDEQQKPLSEIYEPLINKQNNMKMYVLCNEIHPQFKDFFIEITEKQLIDIVESILKVSMEDNKKNFRIIYHTIRKYDNDDETLHKHRIENGKEWTELMYNILLFYCLRKIIFPTKNIPIGYIPIDLAKPV
jgi:hypothetical protein